MAQRFYKNTHNTGLLLLLSLLSLPSVPDASLHSSFLLTRWTSQRFRGTAPRPSRWYEQQLAQELKTSCLNASVSVLWSSAHERVEAKSSKHNNNNNNYNNKYRTHSLRGTPSGSVDLPLEREADHSLYIPRKTQWIHQSRVFHFGATHMIVFTAVYFFISTSQNATFEKISLFSPTKTLRSELIWIS